MDVFNSRHRLFYRSTCRMAKGNEAMTLGQLIKERRIENKISQEALAGALGMKQATISDLENDKIKLGQFTKVVRLCELLKISGNEAYEAVR